MLGFVQCLHAVSSSGCSLGMVTHIHTHNILFYQMAYIDKSYRVHSHTQQSLSKPCFEILYPSFNKICTNHQHLHFLFRQFLLVIGKLKNHQSQLSFGNILCYIVLHVSALHGRHQALVHSFVYLHSVNPYKVYRI